MRLFAAACGLAGRDWKHDGLLSVCAVLSLVSILVPPLVMLGVRNGVIATLRARLLNNPALLAVTPAGSGGGYTQAWLDSLRARPDVVFAIPKTREISATVQMRHTMEGVVSFSPVDVEPTGPGDPLLERYRAVPRDREAITLSSAAADKLNARAGSHIAMQLGRTTAGGHMQTLTVELTVQAVLPPEAGLETRLTGFILLPLLTDIEDYKDGFSVSAWNASGDPPPQTERRFARFRLYAATMEDVAVLRADLAAQGVEADTNALEIRSFQEISRSLTILFVLIAATVAAGFVASMGSSVLAGVRRKDKHLGMLRLLGLPGRAIMAFPLTQALLTALCGCLLAGACYLGVGYGLDALFADKFYGAAVSLLPFGHFAAVSLCVCLAAVLAALPAAVRAARIEPSDVLRAL
jgi:putative ABC transport system permease protein